VLPRGESPGRLGFDDRSDETHLSLMSRRGDPVE
jgi:hypothetical protein